MSVVGPVPVQAAGVQVTWFCHPVPVVSVAVMVGAEGAVKAPAALLTRRTASAPRPSRVSVFQAQV